MRVKPVKNAFFTIHIIIRTHKTQKLWFFFLKLTLDKLWSVLEKSQNGSCLGTSCVNRHPFTWSYDTPYEATRHKEWFWAKKILKIWNLYFDNLWTSGNQTTYSDLKVNPSKVANPGFVTIYSASLRLSHFYKSCKFASCAWCQNWIKNSYILFFITKISTILFH